MAKFAIECPKCGSYAEAKTGFFARKKVDCGCGNVINVRTDSLTVKECPHCRNQVVYDQRKGYDALCPVCKERVNTTESMTNVFDFSCPQCGCGLTADKAATVFLCPVCDMTIDVQKERVLEDVAKSGIASVIKYEGGNDTFVWKHPVEDFNIGSQLIVHESQEAIFFRDGQARELFPAGRYTLDTQSIPVINKLYDSLVEPSGVFHAEVYYINLTTQMGIKWGTDSKVRFLEPVSGIPLDIGASGSFNLRVLDSRKLVLKLVGTESRLDWAKLRDEGAGANSLQGYFRSMIMTRVKTHLAKTIKENSINILEIDEHVGDLSDALRDRLNIEIEEYGLTLPEFYVTTIVTPDEDKNFQRLRQQHAEQYLRVRDEQVRKAEAEAAAERKAIEARTDAQMKIINAQGGAEVTKISAQAEAEAYRLQAEAEALEMQMKGYTYAQETQRQIGLEAVQGGIIKEGGGAGGSALGDVVGLGVTLGAIGGVVGLTKDALTPLTGMSSEVGQTVGNAVQSAGQPATTTAGLPMGGAPWQPPGSVPAGGAPEAGQTPATPQDALWDCACGETGIKGNFCANCGEKRPAIPETWDCACGQTGNLKNFCSNCGARKTETWDCSCGNKGISGNFCDNCGKPKGGADE